MPNPELAAPITVGVPAPADDATSPTAGHTCGCGAKDRGVPEVDVRQLPHQLRHGMVFGALDSLPAGGALVLVAPHDPLPLLHQLEQRSPGAFEVGYLDRGPEAWRLRLTRTEA